MFNGLTKKQRIFVSAYLKSKNGKAAAVEAGYGSPEVAASRLLNGKRYPKVTASIDSHLAVIEERAVKSSEDVLRYIHDAMFFEPLRFFEPGDNGGWLVSKDKYASLPPEIGCLIESVERRIIKLKDGTTIEKLWVKLVSKATAMALAAKHQLGEKHEIKGQVNVVNWDVYTQPDVPDACAAKLIEAKE